MNHGKDIAIIFGICLHLVTACILIDRFINSTQTIVVRASESDAPANEADVGSTMGELGGGGEIELEEGSTSPSAPSPTPTPTIDEWIDEVWGDNADEARAVIACESSGNPKAKNPNSSASGLMQIINSTWEHYDCEGDRFNAYDSISCGKRIFLDSERRYGDGWNQWECQP